MKTDMKYDIHAHIAGVEFDAEGNYLSKKILRSVPFLFFTRACGFSRRDLREPGIDRRLAAKVAGWAESSTVDRVVLLAYDAVYGEDGSIDWDRTHMLVSNDYVASLAEKYDSILFGASVNPRRSDALAELERVAEKGACLVKWLPTGQDIDPMSADFAPFYAKLAEIGLPLLCHTGGERAVVNLNDDYNSPANLERALDCGTTVIAAHCGSRSLLWDECFMDVWLAMVERHPNLYGDISAFGLPGRAYAVRKLLSMPHALERLLYGSDFPVPATPLTHAGNIGFAKAFSLQRERNPFERPARLMAEAGFGDDVFSRATGVLRV
jgi:hypothetical protein